MFWTIPAPKQKLKIKYWSITPSGEILARGVRIPRNSRKKSQFPDDQIQIGMIWRKIERHIYNTQDEY